MKQTGDEDLKRLFEAMRQEDARKGPDFSTLIGRIEPLGSRPHRLRLAAAYALAAAAVIGVWLSLATTRPTLAPVAQTKSAAPGLKFESLPNWTASSDALLAQSQTCLLSNCSASTDRLLAEQPSVSAETQAN